MKYGFIKKTDLLFDETLAKVEKELKNEGFGILTRIDVRDKFKEKLGIDFPKYQILGACNPKMAYQALNAEWNVGLLLPCNVIVYEKEGKTWVGIIKPTEAMAGIENDQLEETAQAVEEKLSRVFERI